jgi:hypothetical protein
MNTTVKENTQCKKLLTQKHPRKLGHNEKNKCKNNDRREYFQAKGPGNTFIKIIGEKKKKLPP